MADLNKPAFYPRVGNITPKPRTPLAQTEVREQPLDPIMRVFKDLMDRSSEMLDKSKVTPYDVTKGLINAIPFQGERFAKDFEQSTMPVPTGFGLLPKASPEGLDTSGMGMQSVRVPTKEALNELKWSDLVGTAGASRMFEALGQNRTPEFFDTLDAATLGLGGLSAARAAPKVAKAVGEGAKTVGMGGLEMIDRGMFGEGPLRNFVPQHKMVVKPPNGNWFGTSLPESMAQFKRNTVAGNEPAEILREMRERYTPEVIEGLQEGSRNHVNDSFALLEKDVALNNWVERNLTNYVKKQMATPEDPVRKLAEEGIVHIPTSEVGVNRYRAPEHRNRYGGEQLGQSEAARAWEDASDVAINAPKVSEISSPGFISRNPYVEKLPPDERIYGLNSPASYSQEIKGLGFDHIIDVLREDITSGRIRPEQLNKVSMEQAVRRTYEYDQELARKMNEARATSRAELPVHKDYPEGFKWVQLNRPSDFASESDAMGHSVRGYEPPVGHPDWVEGSGDMGNLGYGHGGWDAIKSGRAKVYSLIDSKGQPHTTVEVKAHNTASPNDFKNAGLNYSEAMAEAKRRMGLTPETEKDLAKSWDGVQRSQASKDLYKYIDDIYKEQAGDMPMSITQIKGKQNRAPNEEYLPYVQDFVKGGKWSDVGDFQNTNLRRIEDIPERARFESAGMKLPNYLTDAEHENLINEYMKLTSHPTDLDFMHKAYGFPKPDAPPAPEGMKRGGVVISNNPDTMMLELGNQKFGIGGLAKVTKAAKKAAKVEVPIKFPTSRGPSAPEIRAMAERMAPQVMGEFVRAAPTPSNPKPSTNVVGKTQKQFEREKTLPIEYENIKEPVTPEEFDYAKKKGALLIGAQGDVTPGNRMLVSIDEQPLSTPVHLQAGPEWELYNPSAWAATDQMAKTWMNRAGKAAEAYEADPYLHYHKMTPDANWYAMHHFNSILGHLRPEELKLRDPKLYQQMLEEIRTKDVGFGKHPEFEGFDDPLNLQIHAQMDPNFRRHIGAIFGGPKFTQRYGLNSGQDVLAATSLPELRDLEAGAGGYAVVPLDVKAPLKHFEADSQTYDTGFPKAGASGRSKYPMPYQLMYRDTLNWMKDVPSENKSSEFGRMNMIVPKQKIDDELIDAIGEYQRRMKELTGKKNGGSVKKPIKKAEGGDITGDDLILEERPL